MNRKSTKYSPEMRERAVRMVSEHRSEHLSQWAAIESIAGKIGCAPQTLHTWMRQQEVSDGPLTAQQFVAVKADASKHLPKGKVLFEACLFTLAVSHS